MVKNFKLQSTCDSVDFTCGSIDITFDNTQAVQIEIINQWLPDCLIHLSKTELNELISNLQIFQTKLNE